MKIVKSLLLVLLALSITDANAQVVQINLEQTKGAFINTSLSLVAGQYQFNIANNDVDHEVGFVLVPKGKYDASDHIKEAYVDAPVAKGSHSLTKVVNLEPGVYEYFCPLNPTPKYTLNVSENVEKIRLGQVEGQFTIQALSIAQGAYQFEISNNGIDREVGFVLVPKGQYDAKYHIKAAYVKEPVANGERSLTSVVDLKPGEYEYFCPLNPTPKYTLTVIR